jgi:hypothetical protein
MDHLKKFNENIQMSKDELIRFLTDNLSIEVDKNYEYGYGGSVDNYIEIKLKLGDNVISSSSFNITPNN